MRSWDDLRRTCDAWSRPLVAKGILSPEDAVRCIEFGADAVVVSNHGGRLLDGAPATVSILADIVEAVDGRASVLINGGIRRGSDVTKAVAQGASVPYRARLPLRPGGSRRAGRGPHSGRILTAELDRTLAFVGCSSLSKLDRSRVALPRYKIEQRGV
jgi:(S)-mandelate dehydrogenase